MDSLFQLGDHMGTLTEQAYDDVWSISDEDDYAQLKKHLEDPSHFVLFSDGLKSALKAAGCPDGGNDTMLAFLMEKVRASGVGIGRGTAKNWISGETNPQIKKTGPGRENMYKLCFALGFDVNRTAEFFAHAYLDRPFNSRNYREAVYLFCMNSGRSYIDAQRIIETLTPELQQSASASPYPYTIKLNQQFLNLRTEESLLLFMRENAASFGVSNVSATKSLQKLIGKTQKILSAADKDYNGSIDGFLEHIYDKNMAFRPGNKIASSKNASFLLAVMRENFPNSSTFSAFRKGSASTDSIRKMMILLKFYTFFSSPAAAMSSDPFDDFLEETNDLLSSCGYSPLYPRNPFDWIFLYCAAADVDEDFSGDQPCLYRFQNFLSLAFPPDGVD